MQKHTSLVLLLVTTVAAACGIAFFSVRGHSTTPKQEMTAGINSKTTTSEGKQQKGTAMVGGGTRRSDFEKLPSCPATPVFSTLPVATSDFLSFRALGFLSPPIHLFPAKHSNFTVVLPGEKNPHVPVVFPGDGWVTEIWSTRDLASESRGYQIYFQPCKEIRAYLFHLGALSDKLQTALDLGNATCKTFDFGPNQKMEKCQANVFIPLAAGDAVGKSDDFSGVDFGMSDSRVTAQFADNDRYPSDYPHYVSPVSYFHEPAQSDLKAKVGSWDGKAMRTAEPVAGTYAQDVAGTMQGGWFRPGMSGRTTNDWTLFLALVHDYIDPTQPIISVGSAFPQMKMGLYSFSPAKEGFINRDFSAVTTDGNIYCYDHFTDGRSKGSLPLTPLTGILLASLIDEHTLRMEYQQDKSSCASESLAFTDGAVIFER
jgi:hypothetical protein